MCLVPDRAGVLTSGRSFYYVMTDVASCWVSPSFVVHSFLRICPRNGLPFSWLESE